MIPASLFKQQPGGLYTAVLPCDQSDPRHRGALENILSDTIRHEAKVHGAEFDPVAFRNVMRAMQTGDIEILFLAAAWNLTKPKIVGATINFRSLSLQRAKSDLVTKNGIYSEDVCLLPKMIRELVLERPSGKNFPDEGIGTHFIRECMAYFTQKGMKGGIVPAGQTFEFAPDNTKIVKIQEQLGTVLGQENTSGLFRLDEAASAITNKWPMPVEVFSVPLVGGGIDPNNFVVLWSDYDRQQKTKSGFTKCLSTFKGWPVTQGQIVSNGKLTMQPITECMLGSVLKAANEEIQKRGWGRLDHEPALSETSAVFGVKPPLMHIHALNEPEIVLGLDSLGLQKRELGSHASQTASLDLAKATGTESAIRPLKLIGSEAANDPFFSLVA
jgi:hypothetical protein